MPDVTVATIEDMEPIHEGLARRARATLGVTAWGHAGVHDVVLAPPATERV